MHTALKVRCLQFLLDRQSQRGFTIGNLLFLIAVLGLAGVAVFMLLPEVASCGGGKAYLAEAKTYMGAINRGQQAHYSDRSKFASSLPMLNLGIKAETANFTYITRATSSSAFSYGLARQTYVSRKHSFGPFAWEGEDKDAQLKSYAGAVFLVPATDVKSDVKSTARASEQTTIAILCEAIAPGVDRPADPSYQSGKLTCGTGSREIANSLTSAPN